MRNDNSVTPVVKTIQEETSSPTDYSENAVDHSESCYLTFEHDFFETISAKIKKTKSEPVLDDQSVLVEIPRTTASHRYCFVCSRNNSYQELRLISQ